MDRIIEVKVFGNHLTKDNKNAGTRGEANVTTLRITFDESWDKYSEEYAKKIVFWDAYGQNPTSIVLTTNLLEDITKSTRVYLVPIPAEAMARAGLLTFTIKGYVDGKKQVSVTSKMEVQDSPDMLEPIDPTPSQADQLQVQVDKIKADIQAVANAKAVIEENVEKASTYSAEAEGQANLSAEYATKAENALGKTNYIGENGNWYAWDSEKSEFYDTGVRAQSGSIVYYGDNPPAEADIWIDPDGNGEGYTRAEADAKFTDKNTVANAVKGVKSGTFAYISDMSPIESTMQVTVHGKNIARDTEYIPAPASTILRSKSVGLMAGEIYTMSFDTEITIDRNGNILQLEVVFGVPTDKGESAYVETGIGRKSITFTPLIDCSCEDVIVYINPTSSLSNDTDGAYICENFQIEAGDVATDYEADSGDMSSIVLNVYDNDNNMLAEYPVPADGKMAIPSMNQPVRFGLSNNNVGAAFVIEYNRDIKSLLKKIAEVDESAYARLQDYASLMDYKHSTLSADVARKADKTDVQSKLNAKADKATTLEGYGIADAYTKGQTDAKFADKATVEAELNNKADTDDVNSKLYLKADKSELQAELNAKANKTDVEAGLNAKANKATTLAGYDITDAYTKDEVDEAMANNAFIEELTSATAENGGNTIDIWERGGISSSGTYKATNRIRTKGYISKNISSIYADDGYTFYVVFYDDENTLVGWWNGSEIVASDSRGVSEFDASTYTDYNIRLMVVKIGKADFTASCEEYIHIHFVNRIYRQINNNKKRCEELDIRTKEDLNNESLWENGGVGSDGSLTASNYNLRTKEYVSDDVSLIYAEKGYYFRLLAYTKTGEWVGIWDGKGFSADPKHTKLFYINASVLKDYNLLVLLRRNGAGTIDISEHSNIHFLNRQQAKMFYPTPTLTFIDDDGAKNALENWESITDEIGIKITFALNTGVMDGTHATWDDVARLQNKGYEFVSHTHHHINLTERTEEQINTDLANSVAALREHGCESKYLVYPYNAINPDLIPIVRKYFTAAVGIGTGGDNVLPIFTYHLLRHSINDTTVSVEKQYNGETVSVHSFKSLDTLKGYIDTTLINGGWLIIMTHLRNDGVFYHDEESRQMIIDLCKYAVEKGMKIQTFGEAYERYKNIMENPHTKSVYANNFYITDCNGIIHSKE